MDKKKLLLDEIWEISKKLTPEQKILFEENRLQTTEPTEWHFDKMILLCTDNGIVDFSKIRHIIMQGCRGRCNPGRLTKYIKRIL